MKNKFLYIIFLIGVFASCNNTNTVVSINASNEDLVLVNGVLELNSIPFTGRLMTSFSNGTLKSEIFYTDGKKNGFEKHWFENGVLAQERYYVEGFKSGIHKAWWDAQTPKFIYHFNNQGQFDGEVKEWSSSGLLYLSFNYEKGKEVGRQRLWNTDGSIKANYEVVNGERFGLIGLKKCYTVTVGSDEIVLPKPKT